MPRPNSLPRPGSTGSPSPFSFSGLKTAVAGRIKQHPEVLTDAAARCDLAAGFQAAVVDASRAGPAGHGAGGLLPPGGLRAGGGNGRLRQVLQEHALAAGLELFLPPPALCTDNAAMVAALGYRLLMAGERLDLTGDVFSRG